MNIIITGAADKRPAVYPLLYTLNMLGSVLFITDDTVYRRLIPSGKETGEISNIYINTTGRRASQIEALYKRFENDFEHSVIVTFVENSITGSKIHTLRDGESIENEDDNYIFIGYENPIVKKPFIQLNDSIMRYIHKTELFSRLNPYKGSEAIKPLSAVFAPIFGKNQKQMKKLLLYKGGRLT